MGRIQDGFSNKRRFEGKRNHQNMMISTAVVFTLAAFVPSLALIQQPLDSAPLKLSSEFFDHPTNTLSFLQGDTYSSDISKELDFDRSQSFALNAANAVTSTSTEDATLGDIKSQLGTRGSSENATELKLQTAAKQNKSKFSELGATAFDSELKMASSRVLRLSEKSFAVVPPLNKTDIEIGISNGTFTERFVHAPVGSSLVLPCSVGMHSLASYSQFNWTRGFLRPRPVLFSARISQGTNNELVIATLLKEDAGLYNCLATIEQNLFQNHIKLHVFSVADLAIGMPFVFRAVHCSKKEESAILNQIYTIVERRFGLYRIILSSSCVSTPWYDQKAGEKHPSKLTVLALKRTSEHYVAVKCSIECVMNSKLKDILSDVTEIANTLVEVGQSVGINENCFTENCGATYIFQPNETAAGVGLVYICDAGFILYRTSACEPCFPGTYAPRSGPNEACTECPVKHHQREAGTIGCFPCPNRSTDLPNVTGADDPYVCKSPEMDFSITIKAKDLLKAIAILILVLFVGFLITAVIVFLIWLCRRRRKSKELAKQEAKAPEEIKPLRPAKQRSATSNISMRNVAQQPPLRRSSDVGKAATSAPSLASHVRSLPGIPQNAASPSTYLKEQDRKAPGARSATSGRNMTVPPRTTGDVSKHGSGLKGKQPSKEVVQAIHNYHELPATPY